MKLSRELAELLEAVCLGELTKDQRARLEQLVTEEEAARRHYVRYLTMHALAERFEGHDAEHEVEHLAQQFAGTVSPRNTTGNRAIRKAYRFFNQPTPLSMTVAALTIFLMVTAMGFMAAPYYRAITARDTTPTTDPYRVVAEVTALHDVEWANEIAGLHRGAFLTTERQLQLRHGIAEVTFRDGATVALEGPCEFVIRDIAHGYLKRGKLIGVVGTESRGLVIETPFGSVVDLGTEFAVEVSNQRAEVEVFEGAVEFRNAPGEMKTSEQIAAGQRAAVERVDGTIQLSRLPATDGSQLHALRGRIQAAREVHRLVATALIRTSATAPVRGNRNEFSGVVGTQFQIGSQEVTIDALGFQDPDGDGLQTSHKIGIWNNTNELIASVTVPSDSDGRLIAGWRYASLEQAVRLTAGETYIIGAEVTAGGDAWTDRRNNDAADGSLRLRSGLVPANPVDVYRDAGPFDCPTLDGQGTIGHVRWGPANAVLLREIDN